ncbi:MAG: hypothetical protein P8Q42_08495 [Flavobacteriales bacterium]|nr:hypothetical protein [Flavobacteriales bacterium]
MLIWILISIIVLYFLIGLLLPATTTISSSIEASSKYNVVFKTIKDFKNWEQWAIWNKDETLNIMLSDTTNKIGSRYRWRSKIKELKDGLIVLKEAEEGSKLLYHFYYGKQKRGHILFNIEDTTSNSLTTCSITINNKKKIFARYFTLFIKKSIRDNIDEVLLKIDQSSV